VAALLAEHRGAETALLRARGASRAQLAGLAVREALLIVLPAAVLGAPVAAALVGLAGRSSAAGVTLQPRLTGGTWAVAAIVAIGCATVVAAPAAGRGRAYVIELAARFRPLRHPAVTRAGLDLVLVALAVLGWLQLRQYATPLAAAGTGGDLRIDPLLAAAPALGVIAGAVLTLRLLSPVARLAAGLADRRSGTAALLGAWQVARRARAGPMVLVALAVAAGTVSWCLAGTAQRSSGDQADLRAGADLRVVELAGAAPVGRAAELAGLPGVDTALPGWRAGVPLGPGGTPADLVAVDAAAADRVVRLRRDVAGGDPEGLWRALAAARAAPAGAVLPAPGRLAGVVRTTTAGVRTTALFAAPHGGYVPVPVEPGAGGRFTLVPPSGVEPRLAGFLVSGPGMTPGRRVDWRLDGLTAPLDGGRWHVVDRQTTAFAGRPRPTTLAATYPVPVTGRVDFAVVPAVVPAPVPVAATPAALAALRLRPGQAATLTLTGVPVEVTVARAVAAVPGTEGGPALLADLPSLAAQLLGRQGVAPSTQEWWLATRGDAHPAAAAATTGLPGVQLVDRRALAGALSADPFGAGARTALFGAAVAAVLLAAVGVAVDVQATTRRRVAELTVLYTLGSAPRLLTRSLLVEQGLLAGFGALTGLLAGVLVAAVMAPLLVLTSAAARPVPAPVLAVDWPRAAGTGVLLVLLALGLTALAAYGLRRRLAAGRLTIGSES
jgi:hypothetical protein